MALLLTSASPLAAQIALVPPPPEQFTADCRAPVFATDQLVCANSDLRALDGQLAQALAGSTEPTSKWFEPQSQWFLRRSRCAFTEDHAACAEAAYRERLAVLQPLESDARLQAVRCDDPDITAISVSPERITLLGREGRILGVAHVATAEAKWQPFLAVTSRDGNLTIRSAQGDSLKCRRKRKRAH
jgi:uncharacterized protein